MFHATDFDYLPRTILREHPFNGLIDDELSFFSADTSQYHHLATHRRNNSMRRGGQHTDVSVAVRDPVGLATM